MAKFRIRESEEAYWDWDDSPYAPDIIVHTFRVQMRVMGVLWLTVARYTQRDRATAMGKAVRLFNTLSHIDR